MSSEDVRGVPQVSQRERDFPHQGSPATVRRATTFRKDPRTLPSRKPKEKRTAGHIKGTASRMSVCGKWYSYNSILSEIHRGIPLASFSPSGRERVVLLFEEKEGAVSMSFHAFGKASSLLRLGLFLPVLVGALLFDPLLRKACFAGNRIEDLLVSMTVEEKVGQMMIGFFRGNSLSPELARRLETVRLGGVILYNISGNVESPSQVAGLVREIQTCAKSADVLPLFIAIDQEGGLVSRLTSGVTIFPGNMALGAMGETSLAAAQARVQARELRILGITWNYAPVTDVNSNPANPIIGIRSFGSDPALVATMGTAMIAPYAEEGVLCTAKHFPGHGDTDTDSHLGLPVLRKNREELEKVELVPFRAMIGQGVPAIMTAHVEVPALEPDGAARPATLSSAILQDLLRQEMGFEGLLVTDSMGMGAIDQHWGMEEASVLAVLAGADMLIFGADKGHEPEEQDGVFAFLVEAVRSGRIPESRIDEAVSRILRVKEALGILDDPWPREDDLDRLAAPESLVVAEKIAEGSVTLVRNPNRGGLGGCALSGGATAVLPLVGEKIPLLWPKEYESALLPLLQECPGFVPMLLPLDPASEDVEEACAALAEQETVFAGSYDLHRNAGWKALLRRLGEERLVLFAVRSPYDLLHVEDVRGYLVTYGDRPPSMKALGRILSGASSPKGHLPVELPGLYPRGWGLERF
jgi:beta-N-acetylhexosaminidase